ncbi:hypothetical protein ACE1CI_15455 [Aerosakkonemataceae cyanobacterium BLCC-F50]|uniref:AbrB family transcriptional regulator n=1 Tax=Floridaenema flaviceps BLCC-F50 TaxID=3153642 RepID=A0ABV4XRI9_9CYAN
MQIKGIKKGKIIELLDKINIPDGTEIIIDKFDIVVPGKSGFWERLEQFRQENNVEELGIDEDFFAELRDKSPGREVIL